MIKAWENERQTDAETVSSSYGGKTFAANLQIGTYGTRSVVPTIEGENGFIFSFFISKMCQTIYSFCAPICRFDTQCFVGTCCALFGCLFKTGGVRAAAIHSNAIFDCHHFEQCHWGCKKMSFTTGGWDRTWFILLAVPQQKLHSPIQLLLKTNQFCPFSIWASPSIF